MSNDPKDERESLRDISSDNGVFDHYGELEQSLDMPTFEFSSPISSIGSNCSSPERTIQPQIRREEDDILNESGDFSDFVSLDSLVSQISPPSDGEFSGANSSKKAVELETIFEDCYLETPPGTPNTPRSKRTRRGVRMNLSRFDEWCKENVQNNNKMPANQ